MPIPFCVGKLSDQLRDLMIVGKWILASWEIWAIQVGLILLQRENNVTLLPGVAEKH